MVLAWHRPPGTRTRRGRRTGTIRYGAAVAAALALACFRAGGRGPAAAGHRGRGRRGLPVGALAAPRSPSGSASCWPR